MCPEEDRAMLIENLSRLGEHASTSVSAVQTIYHQAPGESARAAPTRAGAAAASAAGAAATAPQLPPATRGPTGEALQGFRRFSLLLERLEASARCARAAGGARPRLRRPPPRRAEPPGRLRLPPPRTMRSFSRRAARIRRASSTTTCSG
jgi:hypothetical protein